MTASSFFFYEFAANTNVPRQANCSERKYLQAKNNNPDPSRMIPVQKTGFNDLNSRIQEQVKANTAYDTILKATQNNLQNIKLEHEAAKSKIVALRKVYQRNVQRLLKIMSLIDIKTARNQPPQHYAQDSKEATYRKRLLQISRKLHHPSHFLAKVNEMSGEVARLSDRRGQSQDFMNLDKGSASEKHVHQFLVTQKQALSYLTQVIQKDTRDMDNAVKKDWRKMP